MIKIEDDRNKALLKDCLVDNGNVLLNTTRPMQVKSLFNFLSTYEMSVYHPCWIRLRDSVLTPNEISTEDMLKSLGVSIDKLKSLVLVHKVDSTSYKWGYVSSDELEDTYKYERFGKSYDLQWALRNPDKVALTQEAIPFANYYGFTGLAAPYAERGGRKKDIAILKDKSENFIFTRSTVGSNVYQFKNLKTYYSTRDIVLPDTSSYEVDVFNACRNMVLKPAEFLFSDIDLMITDDNTNKVTNGHVTNTRFDLMFYKTNRRMTKEQLSELFVEDLGDSVFYLDIDKPLSSLLQLSLVDNCIKVSNDVGTLDEKQLQILFREFGGL